jgi:hypothetical protein
MPAYAEDPGYGQVPAVLGGPVLGQLDSNGTFHAVVDNADRVNISRSIDLSRSVTITADTTEEVRIVDRETGGEKGMKPVRNSLIPVKALNVIARVYHYGASKYAAHNWRKGYDWSLSYDACRRHLDAFWDGEDLDPESGLPHLAHAGFHVLTMLTFMLDPRYSSKDDRYKP